MAKNLSERIADRMRSKKATAGAQNRGAFLALKGEIIQALDDRWPVKAIWETLHEEGKVTFSYQAFRNYVNSLIVASKQSETPAPVAIQKQPGSDPVGTKKSAASKTPHSTEPKVTPSAPQVASGFTFNPKPNKEDFM